jgi:16S rRNA (guanine527-N7)-methyltransferase
VLPDRTVFEGLLAPVLQDLSLVLDSSQIAALFRHYELLERWNRQINLTGIRSAGDLVSRHFGESLALAKALGPGTGSVVDIGSGGGFPGVPIAVCWPNRRVTLIESAGKKAVFLKEVARAHSNLAVHEGRLETYGGRAEWATMRGVALAGLGREVARIASRVALIGSAAKAGELGAELPLREIEQNGIAWDPRTVILLGEIEPSTSST